MRYKPFVIGVWIGIILGGVIIFNYLVLTVFPKTLSDDPSLTRVVRPSGCQVYSTTSLELKDIPEECQKYYKDSK